MEVAPASRANFSDPSSPVPGYIFCRVVNTVTLIAMFACLAQVMTDYSHANLGTPSTVMYLFIIGIIGAIWSFLILVTFIRANNVNYTICFFDGVGCVLVIVGVALLTSPAYEQCAVAQAGGSSSSSANDILKAGGGNLGSFCALLRAAWGLGIANIVFFFLLMIGGFQITSSVAEEYRRLGGPVARRTVIEEGYPINPAVRNVRQTTTATVPVAAGAGVIAGEYIEKDRRGGSRSRHRSKSRDHRHRHSNSHRDSRRRRSSHNDRETDYHVEKSSRRGSRYD